MAKGELLRLLSFSSKKLGAPRYTLSLRFCSALLIMMLLVLKARCGAGDMNGLLLRLLISQRPVSELVLFVKRPGALTKF